MQYDGSVPYGGMTSVEDVPKSQLHFFISDQGGQHD